MHSFQPHLSMNESEGLRQTQATTTAGESSFTSGVTGKKLSLKLGMGEMASMFSGGVVFWFIVLRDFFFIFLAFTLVSAYTFNFAAFANREAGTSEDVMGGISRASLGAILLWGDEKSKAGTVTDSDRTKALVMVSLDTLLMLVLMAVSLFHHVRKRVVALEVDVKTVTVDDYSVKVTGLPPDVTGDQVRWHFEHTCGSVHEVTFGRDIGDVMALRQRLLHLEGRHDWLEWLVLRAKEILGEDSGDDDFELKATNADNDSNTSADNLVDEKDYPAVTFAAIIPPPDSDPNPAAAPAAADDDDDDDAIDAWATLPTADVAPIRPPRASPPVAGWKLDAGRWRPSAIPATAPVLPPLPPLQLPDAPVLVDATTAADKGDASVDNLNLRSARLSSHRILALENINVDANLVESVHIDVESQIFPLSPGKTRWRRAFNAVKPTKVDAWMTTVSEARDRSRSMNERAFSAARAARKAHKITSMSRRKGMIQTSKSVGAVNNYRAKDYNLDRLRAKVQTSLLERQETADAIAACTLKGYRIVNAWVTFSEEQSCVNCIDAVNGSNKRVREETGIAGGIAGIAGGIAEIAGGIARNSGGIAGGVARNSGTARIIPTGRFSKRPSETLGVDVCSFEGTHRLDVKQAKQAPSDVLWENLSYPVSTMWKRKLRSVAATVILILINAAIISGAKTQIRRLPAKLLCIDTGAGGKHLDCPAIWNLANSSSVAGEDTARLDISPFVATDATALTCRPFMGNGRFLGNMTSYNGFYTNKNASVVAAFRASTAAGSRKLWDGGFDPISNVDECAAHVCYGCYCSEKGYWDYDNNADGLGDFCKEYWDNEILRQIILAFGIMVSSAMNIVLKELNVVLSKMEHDHSHTKQEFSIAARMMVSLTINSALLPMLMAADITELRRVPFLFKGDFSEVNAQWYSEVGNLVVQVAAVNAVTFPLSCLSKVWLWKLKIYFFSPYIRTQQQLNQLYRPPRFLLSERYGPFLAAMVYTIVFSSGMPILYMVLMLWCALQMAVDRVTLLHYCASPPRYTGKLAALLIHMVPVAVLLHFGVATYVFGERSLPSFTLAGGVSGKWFEGGNVPVTGNQTQIVDRGLTDDDQWDLSARIARVNGIVPTVAMVATAMAMGAAYGCLARKRQPEEMEAEGCPPVREAIALGLLSGPASYSITQNPEYQHLFPPGHPVSEGL